MSSELQSDTCSELVALVEQNFKKLKKERELREQRSWNKAGPLELEVAV